MHFRTFLKTGVEVLHLGGQHWQSNAWPPEHWKQNSGRWRLYTPAIDAYLNAELEGMSFGTSIDTFVLLLEVADFAGWGIGVAFTGPEGFTRYKPKTKEVWSVGRIDWLEVQHLPASQQLKAFGNALQFAVANVSHAKRKPRDFNAAAFAEASAKRLRSAHVSQLSRSAYAAQAEA
jgi:class 3 adenylate cyclase